MTDKFRLFLILAGGGVLISWLLPIHYLPWITAYQDFAAFLVLLLLLMATGVGLRGGGSLTRSSAMTACLAFIPILQWFGGIIFFLGDAILAALYVAGFSAMLAVGFSCAREQAIRLRIVQGCCGVLLIGACLSVWIALRQWLMLSEGLWEADLRVGGRPYANLAQPNNLATLLCMGLTAVLYLFEKRLLGNFAAGLLGFFLVLGVALTQSRTPWVGGLLVLLWWYCKGRHIQARLSVSALAAWVGLYVLLVPGLPMLNNALQIPSASLIERAQAMHRLDLWSQLGHAVLQGPLWGYGWNQVSVAQVGVAVDYHAPLAVEHSHNIILDLLLWNGPILGGVVIALSGYWLLRLAWYAQTTESVLLLMMASFLVVHGLLEFPLEYAFFLFPLGFLMGIVEADECAAQLCNVPRSIHVVLLVVAFGGLGWVWHEYRIIEEDHRLMRFESAKIGTLKAEHKAPDVLLLTQLREFVRFARTEARAGMGADELKWMRQVAHRYPYAPSLFRYALALGLNCRTSAALEQMLVLRGLHGDERYREGRLALLAIQERHPQLEALLAQLPD